MPRNESQTGDHGVLQTVSQEDLHLSRTLDTAGSKHTIPVESNQDRSVGPSVSFNESQLDNRLSHFRTAKEGRDTGDDEDGELRRQQSSRNEDFDPEYEPFRDNKALQLQHNKIDGALWFMNPTRAVFTWKYAGNAELRADPLGTNIFDRMNKQAVSPNFHDSDVNYKWTSRNNRKVSQAEWVKSYPRI